MAPEINAVKNIHTVSSKRLLRWSSSKRKARLDPRQLNIFQTHKIQDSGEGGLHNSVALYVYVVRNVRISALFFSTSHDWVLWILNGATEVTRARACVQKHNPHLCDRAVTGGDIQLSLHPGFCTLKSCTNDLIATCDYNQIFHNTI